MQSTERWLPVVGYEGHYEVSDQGGVRSVDRMVSRKDGSHVMIRGRPISPYIGPNGYETVVLKRGGKRSTQYVHRLVALAFIGDPSEGQEVRHIDGSRCNNRAANLAWGTRSENILDQVQHGTHHNAAKTHCPQGHLYTPSNTYAPATHPEWRECRTCIRARISARRARS